MKTFRLHLQSALQSERIDGVTTFVGQDASGSFGVLAGHERMMTSLLFGLAKFRLQDSDWEYLAVPKALIYCTNNELFLICRRYLRDNDLERIHQALDNRLRAEETSLQSMKESLRRLEDEIFRRLARAGWHQAV